MPRILIDGFFYQKPYGFGRHVVEFCRALGTTGTDLDIVVAVPDRIDPASLPQLQSVRWHSLADANFVLWEQIAIPRLAKQLHADAIHFPANTRALRPGGIPTVTTVHDLLFLDEHRSMLRPKDFIASKYTKTVFRRGSSRPGHSARNAVVAVSETTRRALAARGVEAVTIFNTADGFVSSYQGTVKPVGERLAQSRRILHRGGHAEHRNTARVLAAFAAVRSIVGTDITMDVVGTPDGEAVWGVGEAQGVRFLPRISDQAMAKTYAEASCVIATSLTEGFCLPIVEGFGFGTPVITSNVDPMNEIAGGAAATVNPADEAAIATAVAHILSDPAVATRWAIKGYERAKAFSAQIVGAQAVALYNQVLGRRVGDPREETQPVRRM